MSANTSPPLVSARSLAGHDIAQAILESISDGFFAVDRDWKISMVNARAEEILAPLRQSRESLEGALLWDAFPTVVGTKLEQAYREAMDRRVLVEVENFYLPLERWFAIRLFPSRVGLSVFFQDISERKATEEAFRQQREWFQVTLASIGDAVITTDVNGDVTFMNPAAEEMTGWSYAEAHLQPLVTVFKIVTETTRETAPNPIDRSLSEGVTVALANHTALIAKNGTETAIEDSSAPIRSSDGQIIGAVMIFHNVTDRRRATKILREQARLAALRADIGAALMSREPLRAVLQICAEALVKHLDGALARIWTLNECEDVLELEASAGLYTHLDGPHGRVKMGDFKIGQIAKNREPLLTNDVQNDPNIGDPEWARREGMVAFVGYPMILDGQVLGVLAVFATHELSEMVIKELAAVADGITQWVQRKRGEEELQKSEASLRALGNSIGHLVWAAHADGFIHWFNQRWYEYTGKTPEEMEGWGWQSVHDPAVLPQVMEKWTAATAEGVAFEMVFPLRGADGIYRTFLTRANPHRDSSGRIVQWFGTNTDITTQKESEALLRQSAEELRTAKEVAESASQAKDNFIAALSHELRTPLNPVLMTAAALSQDETVEPHLRETFAMIKRNIGLEARLIDDLLDLTRLTRGKLTLRTEPCDVHSLIGLVVQILRDDAREKKVSIKLELAAEESGLNGDATRIQQIIWNLLRNAITFTEPGGRIVVRSLNRNELKREEASTFCLEIIDDGVGMDEVGQARIFEPFEQLANESGHRFGGLGLGLAIVRAIVDLHGGTISAKSAGLGKGSTFTVYLPGARPAPSFGTVSDPNLKLERIKETPLRLLVVEDHEATLQVLVRLLARSGHLVESASSVTAAIAVAKTHTFDLVISDLGLPDGTGIELMEILRDVHGLRGIALTGYGMDDDLRRTKEAGFIAHLVKPVDLNELLRVLRQASVQAAPL